MTALRASIASCVSARAAAFTSATVRRASILLGRFGLPPGLPDRPRANGLPRGRLLIGAVPLAVFGRSSARCSTENHPPRWLLRARRPGGEQLARRPSQFRRLASPAVQESGRLQRKGRRASAFLLSAAIGNSCSPPRRTSSGSAATQTGVKVIGGRIRQLLHRLQASTLSLYDRQRIALASASASAAAVAAMRA